MIPVKTIPAMMEFGGDTTEQLELTARDASTEFLRSGAQQLVHVVACAKASAVAGPDDRPHLWVGIGFRHVVGQQSVRLVDLRGLTKHSLALGTGGAYVSIRVQRF